MILRKEVLLIYLMILICFEIETRPALKKIKMRNKPEEAPLLHGNVKKSKEDNAWTLNR